MAPTCSCMYYTRPSSEAVLSTGLTEGSAMYILCYIKYNILLKYVLWLLEEIIYIELALYCDPSKCNRA